MTKSEAALISAWLYRKQKQAAREELKDVVDVIEYLRQRLKKERKRG